MAQLPEPLLAEAASLDARNPFAAWQREFFQPEGAIYLDGHSLGPLSRFAERAIRDVVEGWRHQGVAGWMEGAPPWFTWSEELAGRVAPLVGADASEVVVANSLSVNLHNLLLTLWPGGPGGVVLVDAQAFPTDRAVVKAFARRVGAEVAELTPSPSGLYRMDDVVAALAPPVRLAVLPGVVYTTGQLLDMRGVAAAARAAGVRLVLDLAHVFAAVPVELHAWDVDAAVWCHYKYANAGPGAVAGAFLHARHAAVEPALPGWFSAAPEVRFGDPRRLAPVPGAAGLQIGTPDVLSLAALSGALIPLERVGVRAVRHASLALTGFLLKCLDAARLAGLVVTTPRGQDERGGHVAFHHPRAEEMVAALRRQGVFADYRRPDIVRMAPVPWVTRFRDVAVAVERLAAVVRGPGRFGESPQPFSF